MFGTSWCLIVSFISSHLSVFCLYLLSDFFSSKSKQSNVCFIFFFTIYTHIDFLYMTFQLRSNKLRVYYLLNSFAIKVISNSKIWFWKNNFINFFVQVPNLIKILLIWAKIKENRYIWELNLYLESRIMQRFN